MRSALNNDALRRVLAVAFRRVRRFVVVKYRFGEAESQRIYNVFQTLLLV